MDKSKVCLNLSFVKVLCVVKWQLSTGQGSAQLLLSSNTLLLSFRSDVLKVNTKKMAATWRYDKHDNVLKQEVQLLVMFVLNWKPARKRPDTRH